MNTGLRLPDHRQTRPYLWTAVGVGVAVLVIWLFWATFALLHQAEENNLVSQQAQTAAEESTKVSEQTKIAAEAILDCTTPDGECYQRAEERTARAVSGINAGTIRIIVAALSCQDEEKRPERLLECTVRRARELPTPKPIE